MQAVSPEEYTLMSAWTYIIMDGISSLLGAFSKDPQTKGAVDSLKQAASKAGIKIPDFPNTDQASAPSESKIDRANSQNTSPQETINLDGVDGKNLGVLKDPRVTKAMSSTPADIKFAQYEKMGLLDLCIRQRQERLNKE